MLTFDQLCRGLEVEVSDFAICEVRQDATFMLSEDRHTAVHYVLSGEGVAWLPTGQTIRLSAHTILIVPPSASLAITSDPERRMKLVEPQCDSLSVGWDLLTVGEGAPGMTLACGHVNARYMEIASLFDYLRQPLIVSVAEDRSFRGAFNQFLEELADPRPGTKVLAEMLMKQCLISLLRRQSETTGECFVPWLAALGNPALGRAVAAMLDRPEANHSLQSLGEIAGMSRTAFAENFKAAFGRTAMECLKEIRLRRAAELLTASDLPVKTIAARVGLESRSYFSRAFKEFYSIDPAGFRANPATRLFKAGYIGDGDPKLQ